MGAIFTGYWVENFEIRVGESDDIGSNEICHKQLNIMDFVQENITCSRQIYGDWVSINKTHNGVYDQEFITLPEVRVFGSESLFDYPILKRFEVQWNLSITTT